MTFLWKKVRLTKLPQLVNDQLRKSQKQRRDGSPLLIQTGFPASLVDLFMKHQDKLKKSPPQNREPLSPIHVNLPSPKPQPRNIHSPLYSPEKEISVDANEVLFSVLKMFFVVVLTLGMNRLTLGIAFSAFLLFFLHFLGKSCSMFRSFSRLDEKDKCESRCSIKIEEILPEMEKLQSSPCNIGEMVEELKKNKSRKDKLKSKMTKFVSKKLKSSKKLQEIDTTCKKEQVQVCDLGGLSKVKESVVTMKQEGTSIGELNWKHLIVAISVVLIGLIGGRGFAIVLTLTCCLVLNWIKQY